MDNRSIEGIFNILDLVGLVKIYCYDTQEKNMLGMAVLVVGRKITPGAITFRIAENRGL